MAEWLLAMTVGPVGRFIGAGRRSRDLWWGSTWVSECSVEIGLELLRGQRDEIAIELITPSRTRLQRIDRDFRGPGLAFGGRISNRLLARVRGDKLTPEAVAEIAHDCEARARRYVAGQLREAHGDLEQKGPLFNKRGRLWIAEDFARQTEAVEEEGDFLEFYAAWTPVDNGDPNRRTFERVWALLDARKTARLFAAPGWTRPGRPKSDLDAGRDSVLRNARDVERSHGAEQAGDHRLARNRLGIGADENLDVLGLARRLAAFRPGPKLRRLPFPPITRVAVEPWLRRVDEDRETRPAFEHLRRSLKEESGKARRDEDHEQLFFAWSSPARDPQDEVGAPLEGEGFFRFDAGFLLENGLDALVRELERVGGRLGSGRWAGSMLDHTLRFLDHTLRPSVARLHAVHGVPPPYYALLAMDGDGVGAALMEAAGSKDLAARVRALDEFADAAEAIVRQHRGCAFYVGGDDLMAYLPLDEAPAAARELAAAFRDKTKEVFTGKGAVSLSGGLAIAHVKADLRGVRHQAEQALRSAKRHRREAANGRGEQPVSWLEIRELPRSGAARRCCGELERLVEDLDHWSDLLSRQLLSPRSAHLLMDLHERLVPATPGADSDAEREPASGIELARHRIRAQIERASRQRDEILERRLAEIRSWDGVAALAAELKIAVRYQRVAALRPEPKEKSS